MEEDRYYRLEIENDYISIPIYEVPIIPLKQCRRCGCQFLPSDISGTTAYSYRCNECMNTKTFIKDLINSIVPFNWVYNSNNSDNKLNESECTIL